MNTSPTAPVSADSPYSQVLAWFLRDEVQGLLAHALFVSSMVQQSHCSTFGNTGSVYQMLAVPPYHCHCRNQKRPKNCVIFRLYLTICHLNTCCLICFHISNCGICFHVFNVFCWAGRRSLLCSVSHVFIIFLWQDQTSWA